MMNNDYDEKLTHEEKESLEALKNFSVFDQELEDEIVRGLHNKGLLNRDHRSVFGKIVWLATAASLLAGTFFLGVQFGRYQHEQPQVQPIVEKIERVPNPDYSPQPFQNVALNQQPLEEYRDEPDSPENGLMISTKRIR